MTASYKKYSRECAQAHTRMGALNVLIACEESQAECTAFRRIGHNAYSCDIQPCRPNSHPEWHIQGDVTPLLQHQDDVITFKTMDGKGHQVSHWDLIIAHPPCTYLCRVSSVHMYIDGEINQERYTQMIKARDFFFTCLNADAQYVAVENPIPMKRAQLPPPSCYIHPSWFGVKYTKKTLFWLKNLPPLMPTIEHPHPSCYVTSSRGKYRSRTFPQVAGAMATKWTEFILNDKYTKLWKKEITL